MASIMANTKSINKEKSSRIKGCGSFLLLGEEDEDNL